MKFRFRGFKFKTAFLRAARGKLERYILMNSLRFPNRLRAGFANLNPGFNFFLVFARAGRAVLRPPSHRLKFIPPMFSMICPRRPAGPQTAFTPRAVSMPLRAFLSEIPKSHAKIPPPAAACSNPSTP